MTAAPSTAAGRTAAPGWVVWVFLALLVLPFWPHWVDFEQVRRGLLLALTGLLLVALPRLPRVRGELAWWAFVAFLGVAALISIRSLQVFEALYRIAHFASLIVVLRLGAARPDAIATPLATLLALTSLFGILQRLGIGAIGWYGTEVEPVSVFGNLNVGSEWTAVAAMAVAALPAGPLGWHRLLRLLALLLAGSYLVVNGSRSGMIALGAGLALLLLVLLLRRRRAADCIGPAVVLAGAGLGLLLATLVARPPPIDQAEATAQLRRASQTLEVRYEIALGATELFRERPLFGFGPGQFQVQYPRVRRPEEIELSSQGRRFASEVRTAHDDWIELIVEGGLPLVVAFAIALLALARGARERERERLLPLFVLLLLMFARSPLANAPAIAVALLPLGIPAAAAPVTAARLLLRRMCGVLLAILGLLPVVAQSLFAPYLAAIEHGRQPDATCAARAHRWMWWEPRWLQVLAQEHIALGNAAAATKAAAMASALRPHDPELLALVGRALSNAGDFAAAATVAEHGLEIDPQHPELRVLRSVALMMLGRHDAAITAVTVDPHPTLRAQLASHFAALAREVEGHGDARGAARCRMEQAFYRALETIGVDEPDALTATTEHVKQFLIAADAADRERADLRGYVLYALQFLALGQVDDARRLGERAQQLDLTLPDWQRKALGDKLDPLLEHESWFEVLRQRS